MPAKAKTSSRKAAKRVSSGGKSPAAKKNAGRKPAVKKVAASQAAAKIRRPKATPSKEFPPLDLSSFPPQSASSFEKWICLACVSDVFVNQMKLAPKTAVREMKNYTPSIAELYVHDLVRPWFVNEPVNRACPY